MLQRKALSILFIMLITSTVDAQRKDSLIFRNSRNEFEATYNKISENKVYQMLRVPVPIFVISAITYGQGDKFRHYAILTYLISITGMTISCNMPRW